jgi:hypothetical protein
MGGSQYYYRIVTQIVCLVDGELTTDETGRSGIKITSYHPAARFLVHPALTYSLVRVDSVCHNDAHACKGAK